MSKGFQFKQFYIAHDRCAMKVGTDSLLLGAWATQLKANGILDVGTGSGVLACMLAQRHEQAQIVAIEIDGEAAAQAKENTTASPWANRITVQQSAFQYLVQSKNRAYDLIICNPPYFEKALLPADAQRTQARHSTSLSYDELLTGSYSLLQQYGSLQLIIPYDMSAKVLAKAENSGWFIRKRMDVRSFPKARFVRSLLAFQKADGRLDHEEMHLYEKRGTHQRSPAFQALCRAYYL